MRLILAPRRHGKTTQLLDLVVSLLHDHPDEAVAIVVPDLRYERIHTRILTEWFGLHPAEVKHRVRWASPRSRHRIAGRRYRVFAEDLDAWEHGIYDPVLDGQRVEAATATTR